MNDNQRLGAVALCVALLAIASLPPASALKNDTTLVVIPDGAHLSGTWNFPGQTLLIPEGVTATYGTLCVSADRVILKGLLRAFSAVDVNVDSTSSITLSALDDVQVSGSILGQDGQSFGWTEALAGRDGGDGSSIILQAPTIDLADTARLVPGNGGTGQSVSPDQVGPLDAVQGGNGGNGGNLLLLGYVPRLPALEGPGAVLAGAGGPGGALTVPADTSAERHVGESGLGGVVLASQVSPSALGAGRLSLPWQPDLGPLEDERTCGGLPDRDGGNGCSDDCFENLIYDGVICRGIDGTDANGDGRDGVNGSPGAPGASGTFEGSPGGAGTDGTNGQHATRAEGGEGTVGCLGLGCGGNGGDASANGGNGGAGGHGGAGGSSQYGFGGDGGAGGNGGNGGNNAQAIPGKAGDSGPSCDSPGHDGSATALPGNGGAGGAGGSGGSGLSGNGANGPSGSSGSSGN